MFYLTQALVNAHPRTLGQCHQEIVEDRVAFFNQEAVHNAAAILPRDAFIEMDNITVDVMRSDGGEPIYRDLLALARPIHIGKTVQKYRVSSDINDEVNISVGGQEPVPVDKVDYDYRATAVPLFDKGFGRKWREMESLRSEGFDALFDDQRATLWQVRKKNVDYFLNGSTKINIDGAPGYGIRTSPASKSINLGSAVGGANIDLSATATTADAIEAFVNNVVGKAMDDNFVDVPLNLYVSPEIMRNWDRPYSLAGGFKEGSIRDHLLGNRRIAKIEQTFLLAGNQFVAFAADARFIQPLVGMPTNTFAMPRAYLRADYHFMVNNAIGLKIVSDYNNRGGVFYSVVVN